MSPTRREFPVVLFFAALAILFTWPLMPRIIDHVPGPGHAAPALEGVYSLTWGIHALANHPLRYFDANIFYPHAEALAFGDHLFGQSLVMAPVEWITAQPTVTYNLAVLLSFVVAATGAYFLTRQLTGSVPAGLVTGLLYGFSAWRFAQIGDLGELSQGGLPWILLIGHLYLDDPHRRLIYLGVSAAWLQAVSCGGSLLSLLMALVIGALFMALPRFRRSRIRLWRHRYHLAAAGLALVVLLLPFVKPYLNHDLEQAFSHAVAPAADTTARPPGALASLSEGFFLSLFERTGDGRQPLFPGWLAIGLVAWLSWRTIRSPQSVERSAWLYASLGVLAMTVTALTPLDGGPIVTLSLAVLAGLGLHHLARAMATLPGGVLIIWAAPLAVLLELAPGPATLHPTIGPAGPPPACLWLNSTDDSATLAELPIPPENEAGDETRARRQLYSIYHWRRMVGGLARRMPPLSREIRDRLQGFPDDRSVAQLLALGIDYAVVHVDEFPARERAGIEAALAGRPELAIEKDFDGTRVYRVIAPGSSR